MLTKLIGSAIVVCASSKIGYDAGNRYTRRVKEIRAFQSGLWTLQSEISFCRTMLAEALEKSSTLIQTVASDVFLNSSENLKNCSGITAKEAWAKALFDNQKKLSIGADELSILSSFGGLLGASDASGQISNIELTIAKLGVCERQAVEDEKKLTKLYRSLGVIAGVFIAIIFM